MTTDVRPKDTATVLHEIAARLYKVEQRSSSAQPSSGGTGAWDPNPDVDTITIDGIVVGSDASPPSALILTLGSFMEDIWIDADWSAPLDDTAANYDVELARKVGSSYETVQNYHTGSNTSVRMAGLEPQQTYGVRVTSINRIGVRSDPEPPLGFQDVTTGIDATVPAQVVGVAVVPTFRSFIVTWDANTEADVANGKGQYQVQWSFDTGVNFVSAMFGDEFTGATIIVPSLNTTSTFPMYFRVRAIDSSGNAGAWSTIAGPYTMTTVATIDIGSLAVTTAKIANLAVDNGKLAALAVDAAKLATGAVTDTKIADLAVTTNKLNAAAVTTAKIANLAVDNAQLAALAVDSAKLANSAVTSTKIANLAVGTAAIANLAVGSAQIADAAIVTAKINDAAIVTAKIADAAIVTAKIGDAQISSAKIANLAVGTAAIAALAVGSAQIADASIIQAKIGLLAVGSAQIADLAVTTAKIENLAVDNAKIADLDAAKITAGTISAARIAANSIDVDKLTTSTLTSKTITLGSGGTLKIGTPPTTGIFINDQGIRLYSGGVVKVALDVAGTASFEGNISASTITSSTLTSATINSGTITGTTVRTASSGQRVALEAATIDSIKFYTGNGSESVAGRIAVVLSGSSLICQIDSPRSSGNDWASQTLTSITGGGGSSCNWIISNGTPTIKSSFSLTSPSNGGTTKLLGQGISMAQFLFSVSGTSAEARLVGSGNYGFLYLMGGLHANTLNVNIGLGSGFHLMNDSNASFVPVQASAFNVSSTRTVKKNIRKETDSALSRIAAMEVVRFQRVNDSTAEQIEKMPAHLRREIELEEIGLIAEDVFRIFPEAVLTDETGHPRSINLGILVALLLKAVQELTAKGK